MYILYNLSGGYSEIDYDRKKDFSMFESVSIVFGLKCESHKTLISHVKR